MTVKCAQPGAQVRAFGNARPDQPAAPIDEGLKLHAGTKTLKQAGRGSGRHGNPPDGVISVIRILTKKPDVADLVPQPDRVMGVQFLYLAEF